MKENVSELFLEITLTIVSFFYPVFTFLALVSWAHKAVNYQNCRWGEEVKHYSLTSVHPEAE
jgi:hypothetical protein